MKQYKNLSPTTRLAISAALLILLVVMLMFDIAPGFFTGFVGGLAISTLIAELFFYFGKHTS